MSNEYKRPAVILTEEMKRAARNAPLPMVFLDSISARQDVEFESKFNAAIAAAPQPQALGDDLERGMDLGMFLAEMKNVKAERDQLKAEAEQLSETSMSQESMIEQLMALRDEQAKALHTLISVARTVNRNDASEIRVPDDDEPQYRQRKEWIEYLLETCAEAEALSRPAESEQAKPREIPSRTIKLSGCEFTEDDLLRRAVRAVGGSRRNTMPRWALVRDAFGCGSGVGTALCRRFGYDPEEILKS
ncbi:hypothetical protein [Pseudomonas syringae]|uniref:hypothetical protein n=1 Tax=Pseudomonas syringae TaxID=317 RepID=UPI003204DBBF